MNHKYLRRRLRHEVLQAWCGSKRAWIRLLAVMKSPAANSAEPAVRVTDLGFSHPKSRQAQSLLLQKINLAIRPGEVVGLSGLSGGGKSTLGDLMLGLRRPLEGQVYWGGQQIFQNGHKPPAGLRPFYQKIYQDPTASFPPGQSTGQSLRDVIRYHRLGQSHDDVNRLLQKTIEPLGLGMEHLKRRPNQLSGGEMQRLALARVMLLKPRFLVADEPTSRLDISVQAMIIRLITDLAGAFDCAVLLISHDRKLIDAVCYRAYRLGVEAGSPGGATLQEL
jgi:ABC-type glutathione transport system ATPase component